MGIFLNFRNGDGDYFVNLLDELASGQFGDDRVFRSRRSIELGVDYRPALVAAVERSDVLLAIIGPNWLMSQNGTRRIDKPDDWVRREIATAIDLGKRVIPLYLGISRPRLSETDNLPEDIAQIIHRQYEIIDERDPRSSIEKLLRKLIDLEPELGVGVIPGLDRIVEWRDRWLRTTEPPLPLPLVLAGREREVVDLREWLAGSPAVRTIRAGSEEDAIAFVAAVHAEHLGNSRAVVALTEAGAKHCERLYGPLLVVARPADLDARTLLDKGHHVLVVRQGAASGRERGALSLPRLAVTEVSQLLESIGLQASRARQLAGVARRSLTALRRRMAVAYAGEPSWKAMPQAAIASALVLVGSWSATDATDHEILADLVGQPWPEIENLAIETARSADPLLHRSGTRWQLADPQDAYWALSDWFRKGGLVRWHGIAVDLLAEADPIFEVEPGHRSLERYRGTRRRGSDELRRGIATAAALLGSDGETRLDHGHSAAVYAARMVREVLKRCNDDRNGLRWHSVATELPLLAEAAPQVFLDAVEAGLNGPEPVLHHMLAAPDGNEMTGRHSPHVYLLWSVEALCWSADHLPRGARLLARLAEIYPGGRTESQPLNSLRRIFHPFMPYTSASASLRLQVIDGLRNVCPGTWWSLLLELIPSPDQLHIRTFEPEFRADWVPDNTAVSPDAATSNLEAIVDRLLAGTAEDIARWTAVIDHIRWLPPVLALRVVEQLRSVDTGSFAENQVLSIWEAARSLIALHRSVEAGLLSEDVAEALDSWVVDQAPVGLPQHHAWLFDWHPRIPGLNTMDLRASEAEADRLRRDAVRAVLDSHGLTGLLQLAADARRPDLVGAITVDVDRDVLFGEVVTMLGADGYRGQFAAGWIQRVLVAVADDWAVRLAAVMPSMADPQQTALLLVTTWTPVIGPVLDAANEGVRGSFWAQVAPWPIVGEPDWFVEQLLEHDRPWAAIDMMSMASSGDDDGSWQPTTDQVISALMLALRPDTGDRPFGAVSSYAIGQLFDFLYRAQVDDFTLARLALMYRSVLSRPGRSDVLGKVLAANPEVYADVVTVAYDEPHDEGRVWVEAQLALSTWRTLPGTSADGRIDRDQLHDWVSRARALLAASDLVARHSEEVIGGMLSGSPAGLDGAWPAEPVRQLLDEAGTDLLAAGFVDGTTLPQEPTFRGAFEGGQQERGLAEKHDGYAAVIAPMWPHCASVLHLCAEQFRSLGRMWDDEADDDHDVS